MRVTIWGCRGSVATPGPDTVRYGGNTSCVEVRLDDGTIVVLDAGTGIRRLGLALGAEEAQKIHVLLTHLHLDHLEGLGFFAPIWNPDTELHVWGPPSPLRELETQIARYFSPPLFPIELAEVPARVSFHTVGDEPWEIGGARITAQPVSHPGPTIGYRIEEGGTSLAYIPDHEPVLGVALRELEPEWISGFGLAAGVDLLLHDSQYTEEEYDAHVGWGHSSVADAVAFADLAGVRRLILFHHDPTRGDGDLEPIAARARELWGDRPSPPELAYEGMQIDLAEAAGDEPGGDVRADPAGRR